MMVSVSVPPVSIWLSGGYLNWKLYLKLVKINQLLVTEVGVGVKDGTVPTGVGEEVAVASETRMSTTNGSLAEGPIPNSVPEALRSFQRLV